MNNKIFLARIKQEKCMNKNKFNGTCFTSYNLGKVILLLIVAYLLIKR